MALADSLIMTSKFRGCLIGSVLGDCLGYPYEGDDSPSPVVLQKFFDNFESATYKGPLLQYTDDTAMTKCIAESLIEKENIDARDVANRFVKEYYSTKMPRGYGGHVVSVFAKLRATKCQDPYGPAREQFGGMGSFGNGGAMRIAPIALFFRGHDMQTLARAAQDVTEITHTHTNGINGAILQCLAIEQSLGLQQPVDATAFLEELIAKMQLYECGSDDELVDEEARPFTKRLLWALSLLQKEKSGLKKINEKEDVLVRLGSGVSALTSVPTAIFCFLRAHQGSIPRIETSNPLRRTIQYAISLGGDTDTISAMAGALSGAVLGYKPEYFNAHLLKQCEGVEDMLHLADGLNSKWCKWQGGNK